VEKIITTVTEIKKDILPAGHFFYIYIKEHEVRIEYSASTKIGKAINEIIPFKHKATSILDQSLLVGDSRGFFEEYMRLKRRTHFKIKPIKVLQTAHVR